MITKLGRAGLIHCSVTREDDTANPNDQESLLDLSRGQPNEIAQAAEYAAS